MRKKLVTTQMMVRISLLSTISFILFRILEIPIAGFYKIDLSGIPVLLAGFSMGPLAGVLTLAIKDILGGFIGSSSLGVGEIADFFMLASLVLPVAIIYQNRRTRTTVLWGLLGGTFLMIISGILLNYFLLVPWYANIFGVPIQYLVNQIDDLIPFLKIDTLEKLVLYVAGPFNLLKGLVLSILTYWIYPYLSPLLKKGRV